jgi:hypothetical protein
MTVSLSIVIASAAASHFLTAPTDLAALPQQVQLVQAVPETEARTPELMPINGTAAIPPSQSIVPPIPEPEDAGERAYERLVREAWSFRIDRASPHADRLMEVGTPIQQICGFYLVLRSEAWLAAIMGDGHRLDIGLEMLDRALAVRGRALISPEFDHDSLDRHIALLDEAIGNSFLAVQRARSQMHRPSIDAAFVKLRDSRPWYWWDDRTGEVESAMSLVPALRDQLLVDLYTEGRLSQFHEELTSAGRNDLSVAAGLTDGKGVHLIERRGVNRRHGEGRLIPEYARVFDASNARILDPIGPRQAAAAIAGGSQ